MIPLRHRLPILLLALLLALMPMQSLLAAMLAQSAPADGHQGMGHAPAMSLHSDGSGAMDPGCRHCQSPDDCTGQGCSLNHCLSCVPVVNSQQSLGMTTFRSIVQSMAQDGLKSHFASHPFRPPIA